MAPRARPMARSARTARRSTPGRPTQTVSARVSRPVERTAPPLQYNPAPSQNLPPVTVTPQPPAVDTRVTPDGTQIPLPTPSYPGAPAPDGGSYAEPLPPTYTESAPVDYPEYAPMHQSMPVPSSMMEDAAPTGPEFWEATSYADPFDATEEEDMYEIGVDTGGYDVALDIDYEEESDALRGTITIAFPNGTHRQMQLKLPIRKIRREVARALIQQSPVGISLGGLKKAASTIANRVGAKRMLAQVKAIANNPAFKAGLKAAGTIYPPLGISIAAVNKASALVTAVKAGSEEAKQQVKAIAEAAQAGSPDAEKAFIALSAIYKASNEGVDVSGWSVNLFKTQVDYYLGKNNWFGPIISVRPSARAR